MQCGICLGDIEADAVQLEGCSHQLHAHCAVRWFRTERAQGRCPVCRAQPPGPSDEAETPQAAMDVLVVMDATTLPPQQLHRMMAPFIYNHRRESALFRATRDSYMADRRRYRAALATGTCTVQRASRLASRLTLSSQSLLMQIAR